MSVRYEKEEKGMGNIRNLNKNWRFRKENGEWEKVDIPHTWNGKDGQDGTGMWRGKGYYEKKIIFSEEELGKVLYLEIGAASQVSYVFVNERLAYTSTCPYSLYRVALNEYLVPGENTVLIEADNSHRDTVYPYMADFSFYGGLYRNVNLIEVENIHFDCLDGSRDGVYVSARQAEGNAWALNIKGNIVNKGAECKATVSCKLIDENNVVCQKSAEIYVKEKKDFSVDFTVDNPHLWNGVKDPHLYELCIAIEVDEKVVDERKIPFGFRDIRITAERGFFLNGEHIKIRGMARHQDFGELGYAITEKEMEQDMALLLELGMGRGPVHQFATDQ